MEAGGGAPGGGIGGKMQKEAVVVAVVEALRAELEGVIKTALLAHDEATNEETRAESQYDTRGLEASYLAHGLTDRVLHLRGLLSYFETLRPTPADPDQEIAVGTLVRLRHGQETASRWCLLAPQGGLTVTVDGVRVVVLSPASPLGAVLVDAICGDVVEYASPRGIHQIEVLEVA